MKDKIISIVSNLEQVFEFDFTDAFPEDKSKSVRILPSDNIKKTVFDIKNSYEFDSDICIIKLHSICFKTNSYYNCLSDYINLPHKKDFTKQSIESVKLLIDTISGIIDLYSEWELFYFIPRMNQIKSMGFNFDDNFSFKPQDILKLNKMVFSKQFFKTYLHHGGQDKIFISDKYVFYPEIGISSDINSWLDFLSKQKEFIKKADSDKIFITLFGKLSNINPILSSFVFTIHKGDTIWIVSDQIHFDNPRQPHLRMERASIWRNYDDKIENCDLPYEIFENIEELAIQQNQIIKNKIIKYDILKEVREEFDLYRKNHKSGTYHKTSEIITKKKISEYLTSLGVDFSSIHVDRKERYFFDSDTPNYGTIKKNGEVIVRWDKDEFIFINPIFIKYDINSLSDSNKAFILLLSNEIINFLSIDNNNISTGMTTAKKFINNKLLSGENILLNDNTKMEYWNDKNKNRFNEIMETLNSLDLNKNYKSLEKASYNEIMSNPMYDANWLATNDNLESLSEWLILDNRFVDTIEPLLLQLKNRSYADTKEFEKMIFSSKTVYNKILNSICKSVTNLISPHGINGDYCETIIINRRTKKEGVDIYRGVGIGKSDNFMDADICECCGKNKAKHTYQINIRHYAGFMWLLDLTDRKQLPPYYQNYKYYGHKAYSGNSLLDQIHPYLRLYDPLSEERPNGITYGFYICHNCANIHSIKKDNIKINI